MRRKSLYLRYFTVILQTPRRNKFNIKNRWQFILQGNLFKSNTYMYGFPWLKNHGPIEAMRKEIEDFKSDKVSMVEKSWPY